jgi:hypothetical protein
VPEILQPSFHDSPVGLGAVRVPWRINIPQRALASPVGQPRGDRLGPSATTRARVDGRRTYVIQRVIATVVHAPLSLNM